MAKRRLATVKQQKLKRWDSPAWQKDGSTAISRKNRLDGCLACGKRQVVALKSKN